MADEKSERWPYPEHRQRLKDELEASKRRGDDVKVAHLEATLAELEAANAKKKTKAVEPDS